MPTSLLYTSEQWVKRRDKVGDCSVDSLVREAKVRCVVQSGQKQQNQLSDELARNINEASTWQAEHQTRDRRC